jgi:hypothetical protein
MLIRRNRLSAVCSLMISLTGAVAVQSAVAQSASATTPTPTPISFTRSYAFPAVGLAGTETLQVNVVNMATVPTGSAVTASCAGTVSFANSSGAAIGTPAKFTIGAGQIFSAPLPFGSSGYSSRGEILATVQQTLAVPSSSLCSLAISLEVFDNGTGVTHAILTAPAAVAEPIGVVVPAPVR